MPPDSPTRRSAIRKLGLAGPRQLEEWEEVAGVPVPVQVGVQPRLLTPWGVPGAVLEAQLIVHLPGEQRRPRQADHKGTNLGYAPGAAAVELLGGLHAERPGPELLTWRGSGSVLLLKWCLKMTAASTLPERLSRRT